MFNRICGLLLIFLCLLLHPLIVSAQTAASATTFAFNVTSFPVVEFYLDLRDAEGNFVHGLQRTQVQVLENGRVLPVASLKELRSGVQFVVAINPGPVFAVRNSRGSSRYDLLVETLGRWAQNRQGSTIDDWSLISAGGSELLHTSDPMNWHAALTGAQVDARQAEPSLEILIRAIEIAAETTPRTGMGKAVLFITPPLGDDQLLTSLQNLTAEAIEKDVRISVWTVIPEGAPITEMIETMAQLAADTGGQFATFSGEEDIPLPEEFLEPLRSTYQVSYLSNIRQSGTHEAAIQVSVDEAEIAGPTHQFSLDILAPEPVFISPPMEIVRKPPEETGSRSSEEIALEEYLPGAVDLEILVDFPDGRARELTSTRLYVDGALIDENSEPPFDEFTWNLRNYSNDGTHALRVEAEDILGMAGTSIETFIELKVEQPSQNILSTFSRNTPILAGLIVLMSGSILLLVLILGGQIQPRRWGQPRKPSFQLSRLRVKREPRPEPAAAPEENPERRLPGWVNRFQWPQRRITPRAFAFLTRTSEASQLPADTPIPIAADEITLGSDPNLATLVLKDPSIDGLHARLIRGENQTFYLIDQDSIAGAWVNFALVEKEGTPLAHGDLIHIGRVGFRFTLHQPAHTRKPVIRPVPADINGTAENGRQSSEQTNENQGQDLQ